jgi:GMP synthase PP-ATPase subunit
MSADAALLAQVSEVLKNTGCTMIELQAPSVGVQGDARVYGPTVVVDFGDETRWEHIGSLATKIINQVPGVTRVLMNITPLK